MAKCICGVAVGELHQIGCCQELSPISKRQQLISCASTLMHQAGWPSIRMGAYSFPFPADHQRIPWDGVERFRKIDKEPSLSLVENEGEVSKNSDYGGYGKTRASR